MPAKSYSISKVLRTASVLAYLVSLVIPVFFGLNKLGIHALVWGWAVATLPWLSNIIYFIVLARKKGSKAVKLFLSLLAIAFGWFIFQVKEIQVEPFSDSEHYKVYPGIGFWVWMGALILLFCSIVFGKKNKTG